MNFAMANKRMYAKTTDWPSMIPGEKLATPI